jgi:small GTP-binding protein
MFHKCKSLKSISDLSKWNTTNVTKISNIFFKCDSLSSKPQIYTKKKENSFLLDYKIIIIGTSDTNKTAFVNKYTKNNFNDAYKATIVSEFGFKIFEYGDNLYRIQLWDLAGQDQNTCITKIFSKNAHGCIVLCDITNKDTLNDTLKWKASVDESARFIDGGFLPSVLVQNKIDLVEEDIVKNEEEIKKFAEDNKFINYFRTSAKMGIGIDECMEFLVTHILDKIEKCAKEGNNNPLEKDRKSLVLEHKKVNEAGNKNLGGGCC